MCAIHLVIALQHSHRQEFMLIYTRRDMLALFPARYRMPPGQLSQPSQLGLLVILVSPVVNLQAHRHRLMTAGNDA